MTPWLLQSIPSICCSTSHFRSNLISVPHDLVCSSTVHREPCLSTESRRLEMMQNQAKWGQNTSKDWRGPNVNILKWVLRSKKRQMLVNGCDWSWDMSCESMTPDFILSGATCCLRLQMKQKRSDRRAWTWFREEDIFWKQDDCKWLNQENWLLSRIQKINVLFDFQNISRVMVMDLKISLKKRLWSRSQVQVSRSSSGHLWEVRTIDTASTLFIEG